MKKSFLNVVAIAAVLSLGFVSCDKTAKAVEDVKENTEEIAEESTEALTAEIDSLEGKVDSLAEDVKEVVTEEAE